MAYIVIDDREHKLKENEVRFTPGEVSELLEYSDVVKKWLKKNVHRIQARLALCELQGKEAEAYVSINTIKMLLEDLDKLEENYREFINKQEK